MKLTIRFFILFFLCLAPFSSASALGTPNPESTVQQMIDRMKGSGDYSTMLEFVHWPTAYAGLAAQQKQQMQVTSAEGLKKKMKTFILNPSAAIESQLGEKVKSMPPEQQAMVRQMITAQMAGVQKEMDKRREELRRTNFTILGSNVKGTTAKVNVKADLDGKSKERNIDLQLIEGKWYLPSADLQNMASNSGVL